MNAPHVEPPIGTRWRQAQIPPSQNEQHCSQPQYPLRIPMKGHTSLLNSMYATDTTCMTLNSRKEHFFAVSARVAVADFERRARAPPQRLPHRYIGPCPVPVHRGSPWTKSPPPRQAVAVSISSRRNLAFIHAVQTGKWAGRREAVAQAIGFVGEMDASQRPSYTQPTPHQRSMPGARRDQPPRQLWSTFGRPAGGQSCGGFRRSRDGRRRSDSENFSALWKAEDELARARG